MIPKLRKCQSQVETSDKVQHLHFNYGKDSGSSEQEDKSVNIEKIKSIINSTG